MFVSKKLLTVKFDGIYSGISTNFLKNRKHILADTEHNLEKKA